MTKQNSNIIFTGPAGTGKTLAAKSRAVEIIDGSAPRDLEALSARFRQLVEQDRIFAPTLHPTYSYADWVEGYRPTTTTDGHLRWTIEPGVLLRAVAACGSALDGDAQYFVPGEEVRSSTGSVYDVLTVDPTRVELRRHDSRSNLRSQTTHVDFKDVQRCIDAGVQPSDLSYSGATQESRDARAAVATKLGWSTTSLTNSGGLRAVYEHILQKRASRQTTSPRIVLMVDEINRADPGRLWGEALTVLEPNKRRGQPEEQPVILQFSKRTLVLPANLYIIGTMNSADRSIAQFDVAYRRRFDFDFVGPDPSLLKTYARVDLPALLRRVNGYLGRDLGRDRQVGHAELMSHKLEARREEQGWDDDEDGRLRALAYTLRVWLLPLLRDQFGNDLVRVRAALGPFGGLVEVVHDEFEVVETDFWTDDAETLDDSGTWWDPRSTDWDPGRVLTALGAAGTVPSVAGFIDASAPQEASNAGKDLAG